MTPINADGTVSEIDTQTLVIGAAVILGVLLLLKR